MEHFYNVLQKEEHDLVKCGAYEEYFDREETIRYSRQCILEDKEYTPWNPDDGKVS